MRRLIRQYGRAANAVFPVGAVATRFGSTYGNDVNFPVPFVETNNPNAQSGCINRGA
jgi:starch-binding outer membrane protein, SusD/RagB family